MLTRYRTPYGYLQIYQHPLLSKNPTFKDWGIVIDTNFSVDRILAGNGMSRDTNYLENRQAPGDDATKDEWLSETGKEASLLLGESIWFVPADTEDRVLL